MYKIEKDHRSTLYYNQYEYAISLNLYSASCLRNLNDLQFERAIRTAKSWDSQDRGVTRGSNPWTGTARESALREVRDVLLAESKPFKPVISYNIITVYTNNVGLAKKIRQVQLNNLGVAMHLVRQAVLSKPAGVIQLKESRHGYRTYFRERKYSVDQKTLLLNFLNSRQGTLRASNSLMTWLEAGGNPWYYYTEYSRSYYFVDHDHPNEGTMLSLVMPGIVRKTMPIETAK